MLYEMLTGRLPFDGDSAVAIARAASERRAAAVRSLSPDVRPELEAAVMRALAKDPAARWAGADEFIRALEAARASLGAQPLGQDTAAFAPPPPLPTEDGGVARPAWPWIALGLTALVIAASHWSSLTRRRAGRTRRRGRRPARATRRADRLQDDGFEVEVDSAAGPRARRGGHPPGARRRHARRTKARPSRSWCPAGRGRSWSPGRGLLRGAGGPRAEPRRAAASARTPTCAGLRSRSDRRHPTG